VYVNIVFVAKADKPYLACNNGVPLHVCLLQERRLEGDEYDAQNY